MNTSKSPGNPVTSDPSLIRWGPVILVCLLIALSPIAMAFYWAFTR